MANTVEKKRIAILKITGSITSRRLRVKYTHFDNRLFFYLKRLKDAIETCRSWPMFIDKIDTEQKEYVLQALLKGKKFCRIHRPKFDIGDEAPVIEFDKRRMCVRARWRKREGRERGSGRRGRFEFLDKFPLPSPLYASLPTWNNGGVAWKDVSNFAESKVMRLERRWEYTREGQRNIGEGFCGLGQEWNRFRLRPCVAAHIIPRGFL